MNFVFMLFGTFPSFTASLPGQVEAQSAHEIFGSAFIFVRMRRAFRWTLFVVCAFIAFTF